MPNGVGGQLYSDRSGKVSELSRRLKRDVSSLSAVAERVVSRSREDSDLERRKQVPERALF